ncbi:MAG: septum formation protein Maf [Rhodospirillaceae bacterium]|nr:septum formation protein Maf [Rhodospirillaceae bacterium]
MDKIILASNSETRKALLLSAGVSFESQPANIDEEEIKASLIAEKCEPSVIAEVLAETKALTVSRNKPGSLVIGADQILEYEKSVLRKPKSKKEARKQLCLLRDMDHKLISSVVIARDNRRLWHNTDFALLRMRNFSDDFLDNYLTNLGNHLFGGSGCYRVEETGIQLFARITGDYFTILGLPLMPLLDYLRVQGVVAE